VPLRQGLAPAAVAPLSDDEGAPAESSGGQDWWGTLQRQVSEVPDQQQQLLGWRRSVLITALVSLALLGGALAFFSSEFAEARSAPRVKSDLAVGAPLEMKVEKVDTAAGWTLQGDALPLAAGEVPSPSPGFSIDGGDATDVQYARAAVIAAEAAAPAATAPAVDAQFSDAAPSATGSMFTSAGASEAYSSGAALDAQGSRTGASGVYAADAQGNDMLAAAVEEEAVGSALASAGSDGLTSSPAEGGAYPGGIDVGIASIHADAISTTAGWSAASAGGFTPSSASAATAPPGIVGWWPPTTAAATVSDIALDGGDIGAMAATGTAGPELLGVGAVARTTLAVEWGDGPGAPVSTSSTSALVVASSTSAPVAASSTSTPVMASFTSTPVVASSTSAPVAASSTSTPVVATSTSTPVTGSSASTPVVASFTSTAVVASSTSAPVVAISTSTPIVASSTSTPVAASTASPPAAASFTSTVVVASSTSAPVLSPSTLAPVVASSTWIMADDSYLASLGMKAAGRDAAAEGAKNASTQAEGVVTADSQGQGFVALPHASKMGKSAAMNAPIVAESATATWPTTVPIAMATTTITNTTITTTITIDPTSLYCFALMMPHGYEVSLMTKLLQQSAGIFACDRHSVFSSKVFELGSGHKRVKTVNIGSVQCSYGGPYYLALNTEIFYRVWKKVFEDGIWRLSAWSVKVDPDAVFLAPRLREHVKHSEPDADVYLNNCDQGLHGPVEVIARGGMRRFDKGLARCRKELEEEWTWTGEDVFLRHCLGLLKVNRVDDFGLLSETHCFYENPPEDGCVSGKVSFHPFKDPESYFRCLRQAAKGNRTDG